MACRLEYLGREIALLSVNTMISHISGDSNASAVGGSICRFMTEEEDEEEDDDEDEDDEGDDEEYSSSSAAVTTRALPAVPSPSFSITLRRKQSICCGDSSYMAIQKYMMYRSSLQMGGS